MTQRAATTDGSLKSMPTTTRCRAICAWATQEERQACRVREQAESVRWIGAKVGQARPPVANSAYSPPSSARRKHGKHGNTSRRIVGHGDTRHVVWTELVTTNVAAAQTFYKKVVGWNTSKMEGGGPDYTFWLPGDTPDTMVGGVMALPDEAVAMGSPPSWVAYTEVPDADATVEQAVKLGAKVLMPAKTIEQAGRFAVLQDPQGAVFAVIKSASPLRPETDPAPREFSWHELTTSDQPAAIRFYEQLFGWKRRVNSTWVKWVSTTCSVATGSRTVES